LPFLLAPARLGHEWHQDLPALPVIEEVELEDTAQNNEGGCDDEEDRESRGNDRHNLLLDGENRDGECDRRDVELRHGG
jgi:hypothetical protein